MKVQNSKFKIQGYPPAIAFAKRWRTGSSKFKILWIITLFLTFNFSFLTFNLDKAEASALSLSLDPPIIEINALPPSTVINTLSIQNKSDDQVRLQILLKPFKANLENGEPEYLGSQDDFILKNVQVLDDGAPIESIVLEPRQQKKLTLTINIPQEANVSARPPATLPNQSNTNQASVAGEGGRDHYFSIIFVSQSTSNPTSNISFNQLGIASNVLLSIGKKEIPDAILEEFSSGLFYEKGPVPFTIRIKNKSTHFIKPTGNILIKNMFGQYIGKLDLTSVNILSRSIRAIPNTAYIQELKLQDNSKSRTKSALDSKYPKTLWREDFLLGFYTATLNISLSDGGPSLTKSIYFFAFPYQYLIMIVIIFVSSIIILSRIKSQMKR